MTNMLILYSFLSNLFCKDRLALNFSFNVPYGLATDWEGHYETDYTSLRYYFSTASLAIKLADHFSNGIGFSNYLS